MENAICIYDGSFLSNQSNNSDILFINCINSLRRNNSTCNIIIYHTSNVDIIELKDLNNINFILFDKKNWINKKMLTRVITVKNHLWNYNDKVIVFDVDMFFLDNPFKIFKNKFDYFYTTRSNKKTAVDKINEGLTGFVYSNTIHNFYNYWINQVTNCTWKKFSERNFNNNQGCGQQFLCTIYDNINNLPQEISNIKFHDATCYWNYTTVNDNFNDIYDKIKNKSVGVVHLKGRILKQNKHVIEFLKIL